MGHLHRHNPIMATLTTASSGVSLRCAQPTLKSVRHHASVRPQACHWLAKRRRFAARVCEPAPILFATNFVTTARHGGAATFGLGAG